MATVGELIWKIDVDDSQAKKNLKAVDNNVKKTGSSFAKMAKASVAAAAIIAGAKGLAKISKAAITAASDAEETRSKFNTVFSDLQASSAAAATNLSKNFGLSSKAAQQLLGDTGDLLSGFGFTQQEALNLSEQVNTLAVDLASFTNFSGGAEGASAALTKALLGERESIKSLGIAITEADIKQLAEDKGIVGELDRQTKAALTLELAVTQSGNAIGDFARTSDSLANQQRITKARIDDLTVSLGSKLLPIAKIGQRNFNDLLGELVDFANQTERVDGIISSVGASMSVFSDIIKTVFKILVDAVSEAYSPIVELFGEVDGGNLALEILGTLVQALATTFKVWAKFIKLVVEAIIDLGKSVIETGKLVGDFFQLLAGKISVKEFTESIDSVKESFVDFGKTIAENSVDLFDTAIEEVTSFVVNSESQGNKLKQIWADTQSEIRGELENTNDELKDQAQLSEELDLASSFELAAGSVRDYASALSEARAEWDDLTNFEKFITVIEGYNAISNLAVNLATAINELQNALYQNQLEALEAEKQALYERAGVAEETAVQAAKAEIAAAREAGDQEALEAAELALKKAQIDEDYEKKKAELDYQNNLASWELQLAQAIIQGIVAPLNAFVSTLAIPIIGPAIAPIAATAAGVAAGVQVAAISAAKPKKPSFAVGAMDIPRDTDATIHAGEMIIPKPFADEVRSGNMSITGSGGSVKPLSISIILDGKVLAKSTIENYANNGEVLIDARRAIR